MSALVRRIGALLLAAALGLTGCASGGAGIGTPRLQAAYDTCEEAGDVNLEDIEVGDEGDSILAERAAEVDGLVCIFLELDTPQSVIANMDSTTAMMGRQDADADGLTYQWSYHPDNGFNMTISED